ncbi:hypothetical protein F4775DRAFT_420367 [Biscogniauxia sp. FL1348]|nr:hypothetical protein F4775DRAFT_420367 [Biscogniauxia sp. FL1348]
MEISISTFLAFIPFFLRHIELFLLTFFFFLLFAVVATTAQLLSCRNQTIFHVIPVTATGTATGAATQFEGRPKKKKREETLCRLVSHFLVPQMHAR